MMENQIKLSKRLQAVADMVSKGNVVCDVGCDHGYVSIYLVEQKISPKVIAMDVNQGPLLRAREHIHAFGYDDYIVTRLSDGVNQLEKLEADTLICAGMGGRLMEKILTDGEEKVLAMKELILQPQSEIPAFRRFLREKGYYIARENMILEDGKFYPMVQVNPNQKNEVKKLTENLSEEQLYLADKYGYWLLSEKHPVLKEYLCFLIKQNQIIRSNLEQAEASLKQKERYLELINEEKEIKDLLRKVW